MHPLVTVKKAASLLGVEKTAIREKLVSGEIKGEVRRVGNKDKWFVYSGELDFLLESQRIPELEARAERVSTEGMNNLFEEEERSVDTEFSASSDQPYQSDPIAPSTNLLARQDKADFGKMLIPFEQIMDVISRQFSMRLSEEHAKSEELRQLLQEQQSLTATIPALQERLESQVKMNDELKEGLDSLRKEIEELRGTHHKGWFARLFR
jgi:hypothetical protein